MQATKRSPLALVLTLSCAGALAASCAGSDPVNGTGAAGNGAAGSGSAGSGSAGTSATAGTTGAAGGPSGAGGASGAGVAGTLGGAGTGGGTSGTSGAAGSSTGVAGSGGASGGGGGPVGSGGATGVGGAGGRGGSAGSSSAGGAGGRGGSAAAGTTGAGGAGGKEPADASAGCGKTNPQIGSSGSPLTISGHMYYVKLPTAYDANKPYPVIFMFNPTNNPISWAETSAGFETNGARDGAIRVYPHPANPSAGWGAGDVAFFRPLYNQIIGAFCVDRNRVFAAGESSGGDFSSILGCEHADVLRAIGPCATKNVAQYPLDPARRTCTGQVTPVVIHGKNDNVVGTANGPLTRDFYLALNHCATTSKPVPNYTDTLSNCVVYDGCDPGFPVYWCNHTDPEYGGTNHGWPRFAANMLWGLFSSY